MEILGKHSLLILGLIGAGVSLVASLTKTFSENQSRRVAALLAVMGFLVLVTQQLLKASLDEQSARQRQLVEQSRDEILGQIRTTVHQTADLVTEINARLSGSTIGDLGDRLVTVESGEAHDAVQVLAFGKGSVQHWNAYAEWVAANRGGQDRRLCLTFDVNSGRSYRVGLILAYLATAPETEAEVRQLLQRGTWETIDENPLVDRFLLDGKGVGCVLFRNGSSGPVIAYAAAREFALELLLYARLDRANAVEQLLNERRPDPAQALIGAFSSVHTSIVQTSDVEAVVKTMIERKWSQCLAETPNARFLISLEKVIRAAT